MKGVALPMEINSAGSTVNSSSSLQTEKSTPAGMPNLSLGEIAESMGVSRQAVNDNLTRTEALLRRMEENIGCVKRDKLIRSAVQEILEAVTVLGTSSDPTVLATIQRIRAAAHILEE